jgi:putative nucleotidyltransferase with HDIG domain
VTVEKGDFRKRVEALVSVPTLQGILEKIKPVMESPNAGVEDIANIISADQVLSAKILRVVNSVSYGFFGSISSLRHALVILGFDAVKGLILSTSVFDAMLAGGFYGLWEHSMGCGITAGVIARKIRDPNPEEISIAALLHDIGKVIIKTELPAESSSIDQAVTEKQMSTYEAEREILGFDHATVGEWLCQVWNLPAKLADPITYHHQPDLSRLAQRPTAIVHVANVFVRAIGFGFGGDNLVPRISRAAWEMLDMPDSLVREIIGEMDGKLEDAEEFLASNDTEM